MDIGKISPKLKAMIENAKIYSKQALHPGIVEVGNVNLYDRPGLPGPEVGSYGNIFTGTHEIGGGKVALLPHIVNGIKLSSKEAFDHFKKTGEHAGIFDSEAAADAFDEQLHEDMGWRGSKNKWSDNRGSASQ
jgi:hypothetical protein